ncbi:aminoglycoside phosphotransferase family protein [Phenylobacterium sp.]|uniref:aminoglycoside phosphotransferase family protein n=1 Tax=Phenylobacterium sp. TaxID=1871053 RepID=UPI00301DEB47
MLSAFQPWLARWGLEPDGEPFVTPYAGSRLLPVRQVGVQGSVAAMLKLASSPDERRGARLMAWWAGQGAAPVLAHDDDALLMLRADGDGDLVQSPDEAAFPRLCAAVAALHRPRPDPPDMPPLSRLFRALLDSAEPRLAAPCAVAKALLDDPRDEVLLHGDVHHGNVLDFAARGWLAIDPWGYTGERAYDYANILRNPDLERVRRPGRFDRGLSEIASLASLDPVRLLRWTYAHAGLAAAWELADGHDPARSWAVMELAEARLHI